MKEHISKVRERVSEDVHDACSYLFVELLENLASLSEDNARLIKEYIEINPNWENLEDN